MNEQNRIVFLAEPEPDTSALKISRISGEVFEESPRKLSVDDKPLLESVCKHAGVTSLTVSTMEDSKILRETFAKGIETGICICHPDARLFDKLTIARAISKMVLQRGFTTIIARRGVVGNLLRWILNFDIHKRSDLNDLPRNSIVFLDSTSGYKMPSAIAIAKASGKTAEIVNFESLGLTVSPRHTILSRTII